MINISYNERNNIVQVKRSGEVLLEDLMEYISQMEEMFTRIKNIYIIDDATGSTTSKAVTHAMGTLVSEIEKRIHKVNQVKHAVITDNPHDTSINVLFEILTQSIPLYEFKVFATREAALEWLQIR